ncbi:MAG: aminodeoxychorismate synthase component I [Actinomycetota bacterium]|nr:aminodeoxychorismate synthase component I [Actinomycetota bacterium]
MINTAGSVLVEEIKHIDRPDIAFNGLLRDHMPFLLESALPMERYGRYSILGSNPVGFIKSKNGVTENSVGGAVNISRLDPLGVIDERIKEFGYADDSELASLPFTGGAVGYFGYDLNRQIERLPDITLDDHGIPDVYLGFYTEAIIIDHKDCRTYAISYIPDNMDFTARDASVRLKGLIEKAISPNNAELGRLDYGSRNGRVAENLTSNITKEQYRQIIERAQSYIAEGDIFQVNLAQRFQADLRIEHYHLYEKLRACNPAPFAAFLGYRDFSILSSSPERFMLVDDGYVETRPIKGTRPRFTDEQEDARAADELSRSEKDSAEHVMIVDVKRNDLGRVCEFGSVQVPELMVVESYKAVHHLVSTVVGQLRPEVSALDLVRAGFPGGSITGAPKIRAMEIIEELEPCRRNIYTGAIGYLSTNHKMDTNIAIRTIVAIDDRAYLHVGGGIVADSNAESEYQETLDKGQALFNALGVRAGGK